MITKRICLSPRNTILSLIYRYLDFKMYIVIIKEKYSDLYNNIPTHILIYVSDTFTYTF